MKSSQDWRNHQSPGETNLETMDSLPGEGTTSPAPVCAPEVLAEAVEFGGGAVDRGCQAELGIGSTAQVS